MRVGSRQLRESPKKWPWSNLGRGIGALVGLFGRLIVEPVHAVRVRSTREYVPFVRVQPWQPDQQLVENRDGSAEADQPWQSGDAHAEISVQRIDPLRARTFTGGHYLSCA